MSRRVVLHIDKHVHINHVTFEVHRSQSEAVSKNDPLVMTIFDPSTPKTTRTESAEVLLKDSLTPYAFHVQRHFEESPFPTLSVGNVPVEARDIVLFSDDKMIEIHNGDLGIADGRTVYMTYDYISTEVKDDHGQQSGVVYTGPPATSLRLPLELSLSYDTELRKIHISYTPDESSSTYYYCIVAKDSDGNYSDTSLTQSVEIEANPSDVFFRIQRSGGNDQWEDVAYSNMMEWFDQVAVTDRPQNLSNLVVTPLSSKQSRLQFDNPWFVWADRTRYSYTYRLRAEDFQGESTEWLYIDPAVVHLRPKELLIRRKVDNGTPSSPEGIDAIDVFRLTEADVDPSKARLTLVDNQLSDSLKYGYTFFYTDELDISAMPLYATSDHTSWANIILFKGGQKSDNILDPDFTTSFEMIGKIIEIGTTS